MTSICINNNTSKVSSLRPFASGAVIRQVPYAVRFDDEVLRKLSKYPVLARAIYRLDQARSVAELQEVVATTNADYREIVKRISAHHLHRFPIPKAPRCKNRDWLESFAPSLSRETLAEEKAYGRKLIQEFEPLVECACEPPQFCRRCINADDEARELAELDVAAEMVGPVEPVEMVGNPNCPPEFLVELAELAELAELVESVESVELVEQKTAPVILPLTWRDVRSEYAGGIDWFADSA